MWALMTSWCTPTTLFVVLNVMIGTIAVTSRLAGPRNDQGPATPLRRVPSLLERVKSFDFSVYRYQQQPYSAEQEVHTHLVRTPSFLERVRSFNFSIYGAVQPHEIGAPAEMAECGHSVEAQQLQLERPPSLLERVRSLNFSIYGADQPHEIGAPAEMAEGGHSVETQQPQLERSPSLLERVKSIKLPLCRSDPFSGDPIDGALDRSAGLAQAKSERKPAPTRRSDKLKKSVSQKTASGPVEEVDAVELRRPQTTRETKSKFSETMSFGDDEEVDAKADDFINRFKQQLKLQRLDSLLRYNRGG